MSQQCAVTKCNRTSRGLCDCCQQNLCLQHLNEHNASLISQLNPLTDEINALGDRLKTLNIQKAVGGCHQKLEKWRMDCHRKIDHFFEQKSKELYRLFDEKVQKQQEGIVRIQSKVAEVIREQETTRQDIDSLASTIRQLESNMNKIEQMCFTITTRPLLIDGTLISIRETTECELDLSTLTPIYKNIDRPAESQVIITSNDRFLLMHRKPNLCFVDQGLNIVKEVSWPHDNIYDMCWSSTLNRFIVIGERIVFLVDENRMSIENVSTIEERNWESCTCSETFLFLSTNELASSIMKFRLLPSIELVSEWKSSHTCARDECIHKILYNNETLGVIIMNHSEKSLRMELRHVETLNCIWLLQFDTVCNQDIAFRCSLLTCDEWLLIDYETKRLVHITKEGKLKTTTPYDDIPYRANLFSNMLAVSRYDGVDFYKL
jgi:hypothetical protein